MGNYGCTVAPTSCGGTWSQTSCVKTDAWHTVTVGGPNGERTISPKTLSIPVDESWVDFHFIGNYTDARLLPEDALGMCQKSDKYFDGWELRGPVVGLGGGSPGASYYYSDHDDDCQAGMEFALTVFADEPTPTTTSSPSPSPLGPTCTGATVTLDPTSTTITVPGM
ncbi:hypothetical protein HDV00_002639 [Rhizophlyctis rosea]|nr:hypothetical protein HDV00_002639 [Rhizophlyctis rosea]